MQKGKRQKLNEIAIDGESEAPDLISKLPDEVLHSIISFLPTKEAVATSVYSKRWIFLWKSLSRLSLDLPQINNRRSRSLTIVDKVLSSISSNVNFFHLRHSPRTWVCSDYMLRWIEFLKNEKKLEGISLSSNEPIISSCIKWLIRSNSGEQVVRSVIPKGNIFQGRFLQFVELNEYVLIDGLPFKGCVNVKTLKLEACLLMGENTLVEILVNCKELEKLTLRQCSYDSHDVCIRHHNLKLLEIFCTGEHNFCLISKSVDKLVLENVKFYTTKSGIFCPNLRVLQTNVAWPAGSLWYNIGPSRGKCFLSIITIILDALLTYTMTNFVGISTGISTRNRRGGENIFINRYLHRQKENQLGIA
ncbi:hypothetical protein MTR67_022399 [Solanum verrucosum]|uniref:F-box domain-containing protein n=1 Tax=Solanum verrucosum TaxID=315347 RepID=A0AAF0QZZ3_SOLVR|nr:hypothetical protein MTR67_022399 [Solanum verrucosum]